MTYNVVEAKLYVGNLSYETTEDDLRRLFAQAGTVNKVALIKDRDTGSFKGFAFITMNSQEEANRAIERFNGQNIGNRALKVSMAHPRPQRPWIIDEINRPGGYGSLSPSRGGGRGY
jgi:RNA recognition motif-containing protein